MKHVGGDAARAFCMRGLNLLPSALKNGAICTPKPSGRAGLRKTCPRVWWYSEGEGFAASPGEETGWQLAEVTMWSSSDGAGQTPGSG